MVSTQKRAGTAAALVQSQDECMLVQDVLLAVTPTVPSEVAQSGTCNVDASRSGSPGGLRSSQEAATCHVLWAK